MSFEEYLISKKIESSDFKKAEPDRWQEWNTIFIELSPASFTSQKLYLINPTRRKYPLKSVPVLKSIDPVSDATSTVQKPPNAKPVFKPKIK